MKFRGGEFSTGTKGNFQPELTSSRARASCGYCDGKPHDGSAGLPKNLNQDPFRL